MSSLGVEVLEAETDIRWREWQARGAKTDRQTAARMRRLTVVTAVGLAIWLFVQLT